MIVLRVLGILLIVSALAAFCRELAWLAQGEGWRFFSFGALWEWVHRPSLLLLEPAVVRHVSEDLWYDVVFPVLALPAWAVLGVPGLILLALSLAFRRRHRRMFVRP